MKIIQRIQAVQCFVWAFLMIGLLWMGLEKLIYGEVQPRIVDDIIAIAWSAMAWAAYYLGYQHGKEGSL